jgi:hypothetical protein
MGIRGRLPIVVLSVLFGLHQGGQLLGLRLTWADAWLDDLLCLPLILVLVLAVHRIWRVGNDRYVLPVAQVVAAWLLVSLVFELALPLIDAAFTSDPLDVAAYGAGAFFFQTALNRPIDGARPVRGVSP